jgi:hypothetical protein
VITVIDHSLTRSRRISQSEGGRLDIDLVEANPLVRDILNSSFSYVIGILLLLLMLLPLPLVLLLIRCFSLFSYANRLLDGNLRMGRNAVYEHREELGLAQGRGTVPILE